MSKQKVWIEKMPENCGDCEFCEKSEYYHCNYCSRLDTKLKYINREKDCPLHSIKDHDRELKQQLEETKDEIDLYNKFVSGGTIDEVIDAVWRKREIDKLKKQLAEKDKEIDEKMMSFEKRCQEYYKSDEYKKDFAIQELEKVKDYICDCTYIKEPDYTNVCRKIDNQIKELKGE